MQISKDEKSMYEVVKNYMSTHPKETPRMGCALLCEDKDEFKDQLEILTGDSATLKFEKPETYEDLYVGHIKILADGSNQGLTGYQSNYYSCECEDPQCPDERPDDLSDPMPSLETQRKAPQCKGFFNFPSYSQPKNLKNTDNPGKKNNFGEMVSYFMENSWSLMIHANGDKAIELTLEAYSEAKKNLENFPDRNRIEHCSLLTREEDRDEDDIKKKDENRDDIKKMKELGISPSFLIGHVGYWEYVFYEMKRLS